MTRGLTTVIVLLTCLVRVSGAQQVQQGEQVVTALTTCAAFFGTMRITTESLLQAGPRLSLQRHYGHLALQGGSQPSPKKAAVREVPCGLSLYCFCFRTSSVISLGELP